MTRPFSTSDDSPLDGQAVPVPPVAEPESGADTWEQVDEAAEADREIDQADYGNPREPVGDPNQHSDESESSDDASVESRPTSKRA